MTDLEAFLANGSPLMALAVGIALGAFCFSTLWWTVSRGIRTNNSALWLMLSAFGRLGLVFAAFYFTARDSLINALMCALGLMVARAFVLHYLRATR